MKNFQEKRRIMVILESRPVLVILFILIVFFIWNMVGFIGKAQDASRNRKIAEDKIVELQRTKERLSSDIMNLETEKGKDEIIREKFGLAKEGEGMIVVVSDTNETGTKEPEKNGFFSFFRNLFR